MGVAVAPVRSAPRRLAAAFARVTPGRVAFGLGVAGVLYRIALVAAGLPATNSDEATMGLMARHVLAGVRAPTFFYGQHYMGALEAYLAAPVFAVFGSSTAALRAPAVVMYAAFVFAMYHLVRLLFDRWFAVATTGLLALGSDRVVKDQLIAAGGYPEINLLAAALLLLAVVLAGRPGPSRGRPAAWFGLFGFGAGLALWSDYLVAPYLIAAGAVLAGFRGRDLVGLPGAALAGGLLLGSAPVIAHDLTAAPADRSLTVLLALARAGEDQTAAASLADHLYGGVLVGVPLATGLCRPSVCDTPVRYWGAGFVVLLGLAAAAAVAGMRTGDRLAHAGRLALAAAGLVTVASYARSPAAVLTPIESARYLSCLLISVPAALWPLWRVARRQNGGRPAWLAPTAGAAALLAAVALAGAIATGAVIAGAGRVRSAAASQQELLDDLARHATTRIYSDYWTCNRLAFATDELLVCAVLGDDLRPGLDRYRPYRDVLARSPDPVYALPAGSTVDRRFAAHLAAAGIAAEVREVGGYRVYRPERPPGVP